MRRSLAGHTPDKAWTYDEINALTFLDHYYFIKETHRLHNSSFQTARNAKKDVVVTRAWRMADSRRRRCHPHVPVNPPPQASLGESGPLRPGPLDGPQPGSAPLGLLLYALCRWPARLRRLQRGQARGQAGPGKARLPLPL
ncbi:hypothetical protein CC80DRAFT_550181 [Byssothecium circinans]|uniref:Uncharacterized protein n=1 Tax=Byssothecium circinans TaxID=147558 RepID=A0A6A5TQP5_9PLEO|nr:hypothetical protein CC80DRAFT_550181 [Byssothecium circinans]